MAKLVTVADAKLRPEMANADDGLLNALILAASNAVENYCDRTFTTTAYEEKRNGDGSRTIIANEYPISTLTNITVVSLDGDSTVYAGSTYFDFDATTGEIRFKPTVSGYFEAGFQNITIDYDAGFDEIPHAVQEATLQITSSLFQKAKSDNRLKKEKLGDYSYELSEFGDLRSLMTDATVELLSEYVDLKIGTDD